MLSAVNDCYHHTDKKLFCDLKLTFLKNVTKQFNACWNISRWWKTSQNIVANQGIEIKVLSLLWKEEDRRYVISELIGREKALKYWSKAFVNNSKFIILALYIKDCILKLIVEIKIEELENYLEVFIYFLTAK
jgi:hypothetical protein